MIIDYVNIMITLAPNLHKRNSSLSRIRIEPRWLMGWKGLHGLTKSAALHLLKILYIWKSDHELKD